VWLQQVHAWLPLEAMGEVVRSALTEGFVDGVARPYTVLGVWAVLALAITGVTLRRRG
jgi:hypothetical protein